MGASTPGRHTAPASSCKLVPPALDTKVTTVIPRLVVITDRTQCQLPLLEVISQSIEAGAEGILVRDKDLPDAEREALLVDVSNLTADTNCQLFAASRSTMAVDGLHLAGSDPLPGTKPATLGRSCHNTDEVMAAEAQGCDYATLSPIFPTASKPGYGPSLGLDYLKKVADRTSLPLLALAGVEPSKVGPCLEAGAHGIAVMGHVMRSPNPAATVYSLMAELEAA